MARTRSGGGTAYPRTLDEVFAFFPDDAACPRTEALVGQCRRTNALSEVEHRPADVVPQPLVVKYELSNRRRELVALPLALELPRARALSLRRGSTC
ncbi:MAG: hypothetical protein WCB86_09735, partial [Candidatus Dormiibacterota bacterium]